jgi:guanylate kinase
VNKPLIITLTGVTCSGKSTLERRLEAMGCPRIVSHTTRAPRAGEQNGVAYHFVSETEFVSMRDKGEFVEFVTFNATLYGVHRREIERCADQGLPAVVVVEPGGLEQIRRFCRKNGWALYSIITTHRATVIYDRLLRRFLDDVKMTGDVDAKVKTYSQRLSTMLREESHWFNMTYRDANLRVIGLDSMTDDLACSQVQAAIENWKRGDTTFPQKSIGNELLSDIFSASAGW